MFIRFAGSFCRNTYPVSAAGAESRLQGTEDIEPVGVPAGVAEHERMWIRVSFAQVQHFRCSSFNGTSVSATFLRSQAEGNSSSLMQR